MPPLTLELVGLIFAAGGFYIFVRNALNQLTAKTAELERRAAANHFRASLIMVASAPAEKRNEIVSWLLQGVIGD